MMIIHRVLKEKCSLCLGDTKASDTLSNSSKALIEALRNLMNAVASVDPTKQAIAQATKVSR
jgi:hypothetical protein